MYRLTGPTAVSRPPCTQPSRKINVVELDRVLFDHAHITYNTISSFKSLSLPPLGYIVVMNPQ
jgi:hypothetical protein